MCCWLRQLESASHSKVTDKQSFTIDAQQKNLHMHIHFFYVTSTELLSVFLKGTPPEEFSLTSTPRRSPAAIPTAGTPTALVSMATDSAEALEAKAALRQVSATFARQHSNCDMFTIVTAFNFKAHTNDNTCRYKKKLVVLLLFTFLFLLLKRLQIHQWITTVCMFVSHVCH